MTTVRPLTPHPAPLDVDIEELTEITEHDDCYCGDEDSGHYHVDHTHRTVIRAAVPHAVDLLWHGRHVRLMPWPTPRVTYDTLSEDVYAGVAITEMARSGVTGLPEPDSDVYWVVSRDTAIACPDRDDLLVPGERARDADGRMYGPALGLIKIVTSR